MGKHVASDIDNTKCKLQIVNPQDTFKGCILQQAESFGGFNFGESIVQSGIEVGKDEVAVIVGNQLPVCQSGAGTATTHSGFRESNRLPKGSVLTPFQKKRCSGKTVFLQVNLLDCDCAGADGVDKGNLCRLSLNDRNRLGILAFALIQTALRQEFFHRVFSGQQIGGENYSGIPGNKGRTLYFRSMGIRHPELPTGKAAISLHGFLDFQFAILDIGEGDLRILVGQNFNFLNRLVHHPILILEAALVIAGFLGVVGAGAEIVPGFSLSIGHEGAHLLGAIRIRIDGDVPALHGLPGVGLLVDPDEALLPVQPGIHRVLTASYGNIVKSQLPGPIGVLCRKLHNGIAAQGKVAGDGVAAVIRGIISNGFPGGILDPEGPAPQMIAGIGGFLELDAPIVGVGEGYAGSLVRLNCYGFDCRIKAPVGIAGRDFLGVQRPGLQAADGHSAIRAGCKGRARHGIGAGSVIIQSNFPAGEICAGVGLLDQLYITGIFPIVEANGSCLPRGNRDLLGIGAGAGVERFQAGIRIAQFLNVISSGVQPGYGEPAAGIGGVGAGNQVGAGGVRINSEFQPERFFPSSVVFVRLILPKEGALILK